MHIKDKIYYSKLTQNQDSPEPNYLAFYTDSDFKI